MSILDQYGKPINPESSPFGQFSEAVARRYKKLAQEVLEPGPLVRWYEHGRLRRALLGDEHYTKTGCKCATPQRKFSVPPSKLHVAPEGLTP